MSYKIIEGDKIAQKVKDELKNIVAELKQRYNKTPHLTSIQVGENLASVVYLKNQKRVCEEIGINHTVCQLGENVSEDELQKTIEGLNNDENVTGIILQLPLPQHINPRKMQQVISPQKDAEGVHPFNLGKLIYGDFTIAPSTALAVIEILKSINISIKGKETVIVGHSEIVGKPILLYLLSSVLESATPTVCHIATKDLAYHTSRAEILIVAVGKAGLIKANMVKDGAIVIDVGINRVPLKDEKGEIVLDDKGKPKMKLVGDVVFEEVKEKSSFITPVPGGVGAVTTVMLMKNVVEIFKKNTKIYIGKRS